MVQTAGFMLIMMPTSAIMGFALATVGFTCWNLAVPLFLNLFSFHIFDALFLTVLMDLAGSLALVFIYSRKNRVDYGFVTRFGPLCGIVAFTSAKLGEAVLLSHQRLLKGTVGYVPFLYAVAFFIKGYKSLRAGAAVEPVPLRMMVREYSPGVALTRGHNTNSHETFLSAPNGDNHNNFNDHLEDGYSSAVMSSSDDGVAVEMQAFGDNGASTGAPADMPVPHGTSSRDGAAAAGRAVREGAAVSREGAAVAREGAVASREAQADELAGVWAMASAPKGACLARTLALLLHSPILDGERRISSPATMRLKLVSCTALVAACGVIGGILYFGGGVIFVTVILFLFYNEDLPLVTGTGCALMSCVCIGLLLTFVDRPIGLDAELPLYALMLLPFVVLGTAISSHVMLYLSRTSVLLLVSMVALVMGVLITFQRQIFSWAASEEESLM